MSVTLTLSGPLAWTGAIIFGAFAVLGLSMFIIFVWMLIDTRPGKQRR